MYQENNDYENSVNSLDGRHRCAAFQFITSVRTHSLERESEENETPRGIEKKEKKIKWKCVYEMRENPLADEK